MTVWLSNLAAYSIQLAVLVATAAAATSLLQLRRPRTAVAFWQAVLVGAGRILPVEARHAAWIRDIRFQGGTTSPETPAPGAFEDGFSKATILAAVKATGFIVG